MRRLLVPLCVLLCAGCVKQDTEILARVGRKLGEKAQASTAGLSDRLPFKIISATDAPPTSLADQVRQRLALDKNLASLAIDVQAANAEVTLKGTVDKDDQKRRAVDLAETTLGVEKVVDSLQIR